MPKYRVNTSKSWQETSYDLENCFYTWGVKDFQIRGRPRVPGAVNYGEAHVGFQHPSGQWIAVSKKDQPTAEDNLRVIYLALDGMRLIEKRGLGDLVATIYQQLGAPKVETCWDVLGLRPDQHTREHVSDAYRRLAPELHPDHGGSTAAMQALNNARDQAIAELDAQR